MITTVLPPRHLARCAMLLGALAAPCAALALENCDVGGQPVNPANGYTTQDKTGIMRCRDRETGVILREQELRAGRFIGLDRTYRDGKLARERQVNDRGNTDGAAREFAPNGQVLLDALYENGERVGLSRAWHPDGTLRRAAVAAKARDERAFAEFTPRGQLRDIGCGTQPLLAPTVDDARLCGFNGPSRLEFFRDDGTVQSRATFENGKRTRFETLHDNGAINQQQEVTGGSRIDRSFNREGVKRREVVWSLSGTVALMERDQEFAASGALARDRRWARGELASEEVFFLNGQPRSKNLYALDGNLRSMESTTFHDNGQLASSGRFLTPGRGPQLATGTHKRFDAAGKPRAETVYDDQGRPTRQREWDESGKLVRDDAVFEDGSRKAFAR